MSGDLDGSLRICGSDMSRVTPADYGIRCLFHTREVVMSQSGPQLLSSWALDMLMYSDRMAWKEESNSQNAIVACGCRSPQADRKMSDQDRNHGTPDPATQRCGHDMTVSLNTDTGRWMHYLAVRTLPLDFAGADEVILEVCMSSPMYLSEKRSASVYEEGTGIDEE